MADYQEFLRRKSQIGGMSGFEPLWMPEFLKPFQKFAVDKGIRKGKHSLFEDCVAGETLVATSEGPQRIDALAAYGMPVSVWCQTPTGLRLAYASAPWINGVAPLYELSFVSGRSLIATAWHRLFSSVGWMRVEDLLIGDRILAFSPSPLASNSEPVQSVLCGGGQHCCRRLPGCSDRCSACSCLCDGRLRQQSGSGRELLPSPVCALGHSHRCPTAGRPSIAHSALQAANAVAGVEFRLPSFGPSCSHESIHTSRLALEGTIQEKRVRGFHPSAIQLSAADLFETWHLSELEFDTLAAVNYIRTGPFYDIEVPGFSNYLANGLVSHNCGLGKTPQLLVWSENIVRKTNKPVLVLTPLAVSLQTVAEANKFGIEAHRSTDGKPMPNITVANYERMGKFNPDDYSGVVADESSIIKHWTGATQKLVTRFLSKLHYRLLCTATPAPNDFIELGTASEALGELTYTDMLHTFFRQVSDGEKKKRATVDDIIHSKRLSWRVIQSMGQWALKSHAFEPFWKWVATWSTACRKPSDLGDFDDTDFVLPALNRRDHLVTPRTPPDGWLFTVPAFGLNQERAERRRTLDERSELAAELTKDSDSAVVWCHLNSEGDCLEKTIPGAVQVKGSQSLEEKEELIFAFLKGEARVLVTKAKIAGLGLNMQHCNHVVTFVDHSYEKFYQCVRRCWRFGQKRPVTLDVIATEGEVNVKKNMDRKERLASTMFDSIIRFMNEALTVKPNSHTMTVEVPTWLRSN